MNYTYKISELPYSICQLEKLRVLSLNDHVVTHLPEQIAKLANLETLNLRDNLIERLPKGFADLSNLKKLNLKANEISKLPKGFSNLNALELLNLAFNNRLDPKMLVAMIGRLKNLEWLDVSFNDVSATEEADLQKSLPDCKILNMQFGKPESGF